jgi:myo-inositol-hexaphosphate 3-phosphohydrolase
MTHRAWLIALTAALAACSQKAPAPNAEPAVATVAAAGETAPTAEDGANGVAIWVHPGDAAQSLILGAGGTGGLEVYGLDGALKQRVSDIEASHVMVRYRFEIDGASHPLVLAYDQAPAGRTDCRGRRVDGPVRLHQPDHGPHVRARHDRLR